MLSTHLAGPILALERLQSWTSMAVSMFATRPSGTQQRRSTTPSLLCQSTHRRPRVMHAGQWDLPIIGPAAASILECPWLVSYTHLRAHETRHDLVCRLLLEK